MSRQLILPLAIATTFVLAALSATAAAASEFQAADSPASFHATNTFGGNHVFHFGAVGSISCKDVTFTSEGYVVTPTETLTVAPQYDGCTYIGIGTFSLTTNGCAFVFARPTAETTERHVGSMDIECPAGKEIVFGAAGCSVSIGSQTGLSTARYLNLSDETIRIEPDIDKLTYTSEGLCNGKPGLHHDGDLTGAVTVIAENEAEEVVAVSVH
jgi:hypothetical protein